MEDITDSEKYAFQEDTVKKRIVELALSGVEWDESTVDAHVARICEAVLEDLHATRKPYKYAVTCCLMQRTGAALHSAKSALWDSVTDGAITVTWPKRTSGTDAHANSAIVAIVTVFAAAFYGN